MKTRLRLTAALAAASLIGLTGCGDTSEVKKTEKVSTPEGSVTKTDSSKVTTTGNAANPEAPK